MVLIPNTINTDFSLNIGVSQCQGEIMTKVCKNPNCMIEFESNDVQKVYCTPRCRHEYVAREWYHRKKSGMSRLPFVPEQPKVFRVDGANGEMIKQPYQVYTSKKMDDTLPASFLSKITINTDTRCYDWIACVSGSGKYGCYGVHRAHRFAWEFYNGAIERGFVLDHMCKNRLCVNVEHLRLVTPTINSTENSDSFSAKFKARTHCKNGHEFIGDNFYIDIKHGGRRCRLCQSEYSRQQRKKEVK